MRQRRTSPRREATRPRRLNSIGVWATSSAARPASSKLARVLPRALLPSPRIREVPRQLSHLPRRRPHDHRRLAPLTRGPTARPPVSTCAGEGWTFELLAPPIDL